MFPRSPWGTGAVSPGQPSWSTHCQVRRVLLHPSGERVSFADQPWQTGWNVCLKCKVCCLPRVCMPPTPLPAFSAPGRVAICNGLGTALPCSQTKLIIELHHLCPPLRQSVVSLPCLPRKTMVTPGRLNKSEIVINNHHVQNV